MTKLSGRITARSIAVFILAALLITSFPVISGSSAHAAAKYPSITKNGLRATLNKNYTFKSADYSHDYTGKTVKYARIYKNGKKVAKFKLDYSKVMRCIGKYNGKFYFNVENGTSAIGVYSYKPGDSKFKRVVKNLNFSLFKKKYAQNDMDKKRAGLLNKRYIIARNNYPTDGYDGYGTLFVYDLKKNKKTKLGHARDVIWVGKKIYWTSTKPYDFGRASHPAIIIKESKLSGAKAKRIRYITSANLDKATYGTGSIDEQYVVWDLMLSDRNVQIKVKYR